MDTNQKPLGLTSSTVSLGYCSLIQIGVYINGGNMFKKLSGKSDKPIWFTVLLNEKFIDIICYAPDTFQGIMAKFFNAFQCNEWSAMF